MDASFFFCTRVGKRGQSVRRALNFAECSLDIAVQEQHRTNGALAAIREVDGARLLVDDLLGNFLVNAVLGCKEVGHLLAKGHVVGALLLGKAQAHDLGVRLAAQRRDCAEGLLLDGQQTLDLAIVHPLLTLKELIGRGRGKVLDGRAAGAVEARDVDLGIRRGLAVRKRAQGQAGLAAHNRHGRSRRGEHLGRGGSRRAARAWRDGRRRAAAAGRAGGARAGAGSSSGRSRGLASRQGARLVSLGHDQSLALGSIEALRDITEHFNVALELFAVTARRCQLELEVHARARAGLLGNAAKGVRRLHRHSLALRRQRGHHGLLRAGVAVLVAVGRALGRVHLDAGLLAQHRHGARAAGREHGAAGAMAHAAALAGSR
eukprot:m.15472 g.15472  ORF g.15472 m.15472 type:complete len:376 (+) comp3439_c0_seq1:116-1243(+)